MEKFEACPITLVIVDGIHPEQALKTIEHNAKLLKFKSAKLFTNKVLKSYNAEVISDIFINNLGDYNLFILKELHKYIDTSHCLIIQTDGFIINPELWDSAWLQFDYIGAPWHGGLVGNGGFSLRSKKLLELCSFLCLSDIALCRRSEDNVTCRDFREMLEKKYLMRYAPYEIASKFSQEYPLEKKETSYETFGFHGKYKKFEKYLHSIN